GLIISPNQKRGAISDKGTIRIYDLDSGKLVQNLTVPFEVPSGLSPYYPQARAFTADNKSVVVQGDDVSKWDVESGKRLASWSLVEKKIKPKFDRSKSSYFYQIGSVVMSSDAGKIAFVLYRNYPGDNGQVLVLETESGNLLQKIDVDIGSGRGERALPALAFSPDGKLIAVGELSHVQVWPIGSEKPLHQSEGHRGPITTLAFSPDGKRLASASEDSTALVWDLAK
ncbi:MAG TPA: hypothetical protein VE988_03385, partial [Gemmataceae bacterium]|nr:hypothetical protein [Gemmataceae bacterium]